MAQLKNVQYHFDLRIEMKAYTCIFVKLYLKSKYGIGVTDCNDRRGTGSLQL